MNLFPESFDRIYRWRIFSISLNGNFMRLHVCQIGISRYCSWFGALGQFSSLIWGEKLREWSGIWNHYRQTSESLQNSSEVNEKLKRRTMRKHMSRRELGVEILSNIEMNIAARNLSWSNDCTWVSLLEQNSQFVLIGRQRDATLFWVWWPVHNEPDPCWM